MKEYEQEELQYNKIRLKVFSERVKIKRTKDGNLHRMEKMRAKLGSENSVVALEAEKQVRETFRFSSAAKSIRARPRKEDDPG